MSPLPAIQKALDHFKSQVESGVWAVGQKLPGMRTIAVSLKISPVAVCAAWQQLSQKGLLVVKEKSGAFVGPNLPADKTEKPKLKWQRAAQALRTDIVSGRLPHAFGLGLLSQQYGFGSFVLRKATRALIEEGYLKSESKGFAVHLTPRKNNASFLMIFQGRRSDIVNYAPERLDEFEKSLNYACATQGIRLIVGAFLHDVPSSRLLEGCTRLIKTSSLLGVAVYGASLSAPNKLRWVQALTPLRVPLALIDEPDDPAFPQIEELGCPLKAYAFSDYEVGYEVGKRLLSLGHRRVTFVSLALSARWSKNRHLGLEAAYQKAGFEGAVDAVGLPWDKGEDLKKLPPKNIRQALDLAQQSFKILDRSTFIASDISLKLLRAVYMEIVKHSTAGESFFSEVGEAVKNSAATAFVAANDICARYTLMALQRSGKKIAHEFSLIGFDNNNLAVEADLASYGFDFGGLARRVLGDCLASHLKPGKKHSQHAAYPIDRITWSGKIIERDSLNPPPIAPSRLARRRPAPNA